MRLDDRVIAAPPGLTVLEAARRVGIEVPSLCHHPALPVDGSCRLCLVEVDGRPGLTPACVLPATDDLVVSTSSPAARASRRNVLRLLLRRYRPRGGREDARLLVMAAAEGLTVAPGHGAVGIDGDPVAAEVGAMAERNPFIRLDPAACVHCWRCVRACELLNGTASIGVFARGDEARVGFGLDQPMHESTCEFCGMCEAVCPTAALAPVSGVDGAAAVGAASVVCAYCGVGCRLRVHVAGGRVAGTSPDWSAPANQGLLCVKGRFGWSFLHHADRLTRPRVRARLLHGTGDDFVETDWPTALDLVARRLGQVRATHGPDAVGFLASAKCTNEENYLFQKLARQLVGTNNVDHCARLCHAPTVTALAASLGSGAMTNSMDDIVTHAASVLVVGSNTTAQHPVFGMRLRRAVRERGLALVVVDPRRTPIAGVATIHLALRPGTDIVLLNALAHVLIAEGLVDRAFVDARTEGFDAFRAAVAGDTPERAAEITGVSADDIRRAARLLASRRPGALLYAMGITQHTCGTANASACVNLQLLLGNLGVPGGGVNPLRGQNNVQGACDVGALPNVLPGYAPVSDAATRGRFEAAWGVRLPSAPGLAVPDLLDAALAGRVRALWILGENAAMTEPDLSHARRCLDACDFVVVQEIFPSETTAYADVVLPAAAWIERSGTFTSTERRIQHFEAIVTPPGEARPDWWIIAEVARRVHALVAPPSSTAPYAGWDVSPAAVMDEIAALTPIYGGVSHARLGTAGLQWPCPDATHPGTPILHVGTFTRGRGRFTAVRHEPPAERPDARYPFVLTTGRVLEHYHGGSMTRRVPGLEWRVPEAVVEVHPADAAPAGLVDGGRARVRSRRGEIVVRVRVTSGIVRGTVFLPFHFAEAAANLLTHAALDPVSRIPEFKVCAVSLRPGPDTV